MWITQSSYISYSSPFTNRYILYTWLLSKSILFMFEYFCTFILSDFVEYWASALSTEHCFLDVRGHEFETGARAPTVHSFKSRRWSKLTQRSLHLKKVLSVSDLVPWPFNTFDEPFWQVLVSFQSYDPPLCSQFFTGRNERGRPWPRVPALQTGGWPSTPDTPLSLWPWPSNSSCLLSCLPCCFPPTSPLSPPRFQVCT